MLRSAAEQPGGRLGFRKTLSQNSKREMVRELERDRDTVTREGCSVAFLPNMRESLDVFASPT